jgi:hypothetical protein
MMFYSKPTLGTDLCLFYSLCCPVSVENLRRADPRRRVLPSAYKQDSENWKTGDLAPQRFACDAIQGERKGRAR